MHSQARQTNDLVIRIDCLYEFQHWHDCVLTVLCYNRVNTDRVKQPLVTSQSQAREARHAIPACKCRQAIPACSHPIKGQES